MKPTLKSKIIKLRIDGKNYNEISLLLNCSKATISYHCKRHGLGNEDVTYLTKNEKVAVNEYYKTHTQQETAIRFNISKTTVIRCTDNKRIKQTEVEKKLKNYKHVKHHRTKIKEKAVEYKGGKCIKCGYNKCNRALEFHHMDPTQKDFHVGNYKIVRWDIIKKELDKCILVCANCHREIHHEMDINCVVYPHADTV